MEVPQLTVLLPVYNTRAEHLEACYESIKHQTYRNFQVLLVNDGSDFLETQATIHAIAEDSNQVEILHLPSNQGLCAALNQGIAACKTPWIARMDADDIMLPTRLQRQMDYLAVHPEVDVLGTWQQNFNEDGIRFNPAIKEHPAVVSSAFVVQHSDYFIMNHPTVIFRRSFMNQIGGYNESLRHYPEDYELWLRCLENGGILHNIQEPLQRYRKCNPGQLTAQFKPDANAYCETLKKAFVAKLKQTADA